MSRHFSPRFIASLRRGYGDEYADIVSEWDRRHGGRFVPYDDATRARLVELQQAATVSTPNPMRAA